MKTKYYAVCPVCKVNIEFTIKPGSGGYWCCTKCKSEYPCKDYLAGWGEVQEGDAWEKAYRAFREMCDFAKVHHPVKESFKAGWDAALALHKNRPPEDLT